jgi:hypothetical protein
MSLANRPLGGLQPSPGPKSGATRRQVGVHRLKGNEDVMKIRLILTIGLMSLAACFGDESAAFADSEAPPDTRPAASSPRDAHEGVSLYFEPAVAVPTGELANATGPGLGALLGASYPLVCDLVTVAPGVYRPQYESGAFVRVQAAGSDTWQLREKSGTT